MHRISCKLTVDPDQLPHSAASEMDLDWLQMSLKWVFQSKKGETYILKTSVLLIMLKVLKVVFIIVYEILSNDKLYVCKCILLAIRSNMLQVFMLTLTKLCGVSGLFSSC